MELQQIIKQEPVDICRNCVANDSKEEFEDNNWEDFHAEYCVTHCDNNFVPKHLPKEQVIKYLKRKNIK